MTEQARPERSDGAGVLPDSLASRVEELEALCVDVLAASAHSSLPPPLIRRLRQAVGAGEVPHGETPHPVPPLTDLDPRLASRSVLVVDDDPLMLHVLGRVLGRENFRLVLASSATEAVQAIDAHPHPVDLLITNLSESGRELAERIRQRHPAVRVLFQVGHGHRDHAAELGHDDGILERPFTTRELREAARLALFGSVNPSG